MQELRKILAFSAIAAGLGLAVWVLWPRRQPPPPPSAVYDLATADALPVAHLEAADAGPKRVPLEGHVFDGTGHPIAGTRIQVHSGGEGPSAQPGGELGILPGPIPYPPATPVIFGPSAVADEAGAFHLMVPEGHWRVSAWHPQYLQKTVEWSGGALTFVLEPLPPEPAVETAAGGQEKMSGAVVDERGFPVAGARVEVEGHFGMSDRAGRFDVAGLPEGPYRVRVTHADFAPTETTLPDGNDVQLQLMPGGGIAGDVRDPRSGSVPAGATLTATIDGRDQPISLGRDGRFEMTGLRAGPLVLVARAPGYAATRRKIDVPAGDRPRDVTAPDINLDLERGGSVAGTVRDESGDGVAGAEVSAPGARTRSDARGEFRLQGVAPGSVTVGASHSGLHASESVEVRSDEESRVDLTLR